MYTGDSYEGSYIFLRASYVMGQMLSGRNNANVCPSNPLEEIASLKRINELDQLA
jgi:hypothetical protein